MPLACVSLLLYPSLLLSISLHRFFVLLLSIYLYTAFRVYFLGVFPLRTRITAITAATLNTDTTNNNNNRTSTPTT